jgi:hypothetical protein
MNRKTPLDVQSFLIAERARWLRTTGAHVGGDGGPVHLSAFIVALDSLEQPDGGWLGFMRVNSCTNPPSTVKVYYVDHSSLCGALAGMQQRPQSSSVVSGSSVETDLLNIKTRFDNAALLIDEDAAAVGSFFAAFEEFQTAREELGALSSAAEEAAKEEKGSERLATLLSTLRTQEAALRQTLSCPAPGVFFPKGTTIFPMDFASGGNRNEFRKVVECDVRVLVQGGGPVVSVVPVKLTPRVPLQKGQCVAWKVPELAVAEKRFYAAPYLVIHGSGTSVRQRMLENASRVAIKVLSGVKSDGWWAFSAVMGLWPRCVKSSVAYQSCLNVPLGDGTVALAFSAMIGASGGVSVEPAEPVESVGDAEGEIADVVPVILTATESARARTNPVGAVVLGAGSGSSLGAGAGAGADSDSELRYLVLPEKLYDHDVARRFNPIRDMKEVCEIASRSLSQIAGWPAADFKGYERLLTASMRALKARRLQPLS